MNMGRVKGHGGFTLVEVLIASILFVIVSGSIISLFIYGSNLWQLIITQTELRSGASNAIYYMTQELQGATRSSTQAPSPNLSIPAKPNNNSIKLFLPKTSNVNRINADGSTDWDTGLNRDINYQYMPASKQLRRSQGAIFKDICDDVASVEFENSVINPLLRSDEIKIILKVEKITLTGTKKTTLSSLVKLRN